MKFFWREDLKPHSMTLTMAAMRDVHIRNAAYLGVSEATKLTKAYAWNKN